MFKKEYLNQEQIRVLEERHPDNNKTNFFERVSKVTISPNADWSFIRLLQEYDITANVIFKNPVD